MTVKLITFCMPLAFLGACSVLETPSSDVAPVVEDVSVPVVRYIPTDVRDVQHLLPNFDNPQIFVQQLQSTCAKYTRRKGSKNVHRSVIFGTYRDWHRACHALKTAKNLPKYLYQNFKLYEVTAGENSLFTGYYAPIVEGSWQKTDVYKYPLYTYPKDIYKIDLGKFDASLKGRKIFARVDGQEIEPYYTRSELEKNLGQKTPLIWLKSEEDAFFFHIQGSGWVNLPNGERVNIAYAGNNGHKYTAIGRTLIQKGYLQKDAVTMDSIRTWLEENPKKKQSVFNSNKRFIFFRKSTNTDVTGSFNVPLVAGKSLAVDPKYIPLGTPLLVSTTATKSSKPLNELMFAHDTGAAIKGGVRGDIYYGIGKLAGAYAGEQNSPGRLFVIVPK